MSTMPKIIVMFDDGRSIEVQGRSRDMVAAEEAGVDFTELKPIKSMYVTAFFALRRLQAADPNMIVPADVDELIATADVTMADDEDAEGNGLGQVAPTG